MSPLPSAGLLARSLHRNRYRHTRIKVEQTMNTTLEKRNATERRLSDPGTRLNTGEKNRPSATLCSTCIHNDEGCVLKGTGGKPVYECSEYDSSTAIDRVGNSSDGLSGTEAMVGSVAGTAKGLCVNCENRNSCMFSDTVYGVWHCEEYK